MHRPLRHASILERRKPVRLDDIRRELYEAWKLRGKRTLLSLEVFPYLCSLRRNGYDFDALSDEGLVSNRETLIMDHVGTAAVPSYALSKSLGIKGFDAAVTNLQNKTYLALSFKKSSMGTALLNRPEDIFGEDYVRSQYDKSPEECAKIIRKLAPGLGEFSDADVAKILSPAV